MTAATTLKLTTVVIYSVFTG